MNIQDQFSIQNEVAIVTGAGGGLGSELAKILIDAGAIVVLTDVSPSSLDKVASELDKKSNHFITLPCDITKESEIKCLINTVQSKFQRIDVLVNCAGILGENSLMLEIKESDWDKVFDVNLKGLWMLSDAVSKYMVQHSIQGRIVNVSSALAVRAQLRRIHYATSKAGVEHLTRNMAMELIEYGIRVNCLAPGWTATPMVKAILDRPEGAKWKKSIPMGRAARPEELTGPLLLLASKASSYMTGSVIRVDGGYSCCGIES